MAEYFKAATKCDVEVAREAPMYIDQRGVMHELFAHQQLMERIIATKQLLGQLDEADECDAQAEPLATEALASMLAVEGEGTASKQMYSAPPHATTGLPPSARSAGGRAALAEVKRRIENLSSRLLSERSTLLDWEKEERSCEELEVRRAKEEAQRRLDALNVARAQAAEEAKREVEAQRLEMEMAHRRVHPIDVLQKKIAADLQEEMYEATVMAECDVKEAQVGLDNFLEKEQLQGLRYKYYNPSTHIPGALVLHS